MSTPIREEQSVVTLLTTQIFPHLLHQHQEEAPTLRIWSMGCQATDEALLLLVGLFQRLQVPASTSPLLIFATDSDEAAVVRARHLAASSNLETWPGLAASHPFLPVGWEGRSLPEAWRQSLIFATHDPLTDVPFAHLDLILSHLSLCPYTQAQQATILSRLAYALVPGGFLLLLGEQHGVVPDAKLYTKYEVGSVLCYQRTAIPVHHAALDLAHLRGYHPSAASQEVSPEQHRAQLEDLQAALEEQIVQCQELEAQARFNREAHLAQLHLAAIVAFSGDAILSKDLDGIVTSWNAGAERLFGYSASAMVGQPVARLFPLDQQEEAARILEQIRRGERVGPYETVRQHKNGSLIPVFVTISPVKDRDGTIVGASDIAQDNTARRELDQQRETFVNLVTHELKTPLTALFGTIQLAQRRLRRLLAREHSLEDDQQQNLEEVLAMLERSQHQMRTQQRLIDDLLDLSHVQQGTVELHLEPCDVLSVVESTVQDHRAAHPSRLIELDMPDQDEVLVDGDRDRLGQVLGNYLGNALKFAPVEKPVRVGIRIQDEMVRVWVQDAGPGLTKEQQARVWERYVQVKKTPVQEGWKMGLGLGLYLCRQLIVRQQGEVGVESTPEQGSTFWFSLPIIARGVSRQKA